MSENTTPEAGDTSPATEILPVPQPSSPAPAEPATEVLDTTPPTEVLDTTPATQVLPTDVPADPLAASTAHSDPLAAPALPTTPPGEAAAPLSSGRLGYETASVTPAPLPAPIPAASMPATPPGSFTVSPMSPTPVAPTTRVAAAPAPKRRGPRFSTIIWGLIIAIVGIGMIGYTIGFRYDVQLAVIILVAAAGVALLVGAIASAGRKRAGV